MSIRGIAHRGYPVKYPENTISSFQAAIDLGFSHMELDVHLSKDGIPVVMHDHTIDRMTDGSGEIRMYTFEELQHFKVAENERIPSLEEVLKMAKDRIIVSIELKNTELYRGVEKIVYDVIQKLGVVDQVYIISFNHKSLAKLRGLSKELELGPLVNKIRSSNYRLIEKLNAKYFAVRYDGLKEKHIKRCKEMGIQLVAWKVNTLEHMQYIKRNPSILGTTDELEKYKECFQKDIHLEMEQVII
ncbi:glycerophosphodiester phosphodiesterase [Oceanobacillus massiliensis]|uniref:glycerophosphodiester phosphodiesterase n=1 Tax=Oceanobacillus massiliensis TaxID=1465765 RepID=UPI000289A11D|nr:glycerophosphodiester phosphodiesterase family protein [Oceanobacillus massiliensis]